MADYECHPLWDAAGRNLDPLALAIPDELARALTNWAREYTATLDYSDPLASAFRDVPTETAWIQRGEELASALRARGFEVEYRRGGRPSDNA